MNKYERFYFKYSDYGKTLYCLMWFNIAIILLNFAIKSYVTTIVLALLCGLNVWNYTRAVKSFCKVREDRWILRLMKNNMPYFFGGDKLFKTVDEFWYKYKGNVLDPTTEAIVKAAIEDMYRHGWKEEEE